MMAAEPGVRGVEWPLRAERERMDSVTGGWNIQENQLQIEQVVNTFIQSTSDVLPVMEGARPVRCSALISVRNAAKPRSSINNHDNRPDKRLCVNW